VQRHVPRRDRQAGPDRPDQARLPVPGADLRDAEDPGHLRDQVPVPDREVRYIHMFIYKYIIECDTLQSKRSFSPPSIFCFSLLQLRY